MIQLGKKILFVFLCVVVLGGSFGGGLLVGRNQGRPIIIEGAKNLDNGKPEDVDFSLFWQVWKIIQEKFVDSDHLNYQTMLQGAIAGVAESLEDPYTVFMNPADTKRFFEDIAGFFEGVGMEIGTREEELRVIAPLEGTPAQRAGIRAGDRILKINDTFTRNLKVEEAVALIRGPKGTTVTIAIFREGWKEPKDFVIERAVIEVPSLKWELKHGDIAYIKLYHFSEKANKDFQKIAREIDSSNATRIILDIRNNPGGFLEVAQDIAGWFVQKGDTVVIEDFGADSPQKTYKAQGNALLLSYPMVLLINEGSASASEILAGALRDNRGILLIGKKSFGKGSVQELEKLQDGSSLKITVAHWLTPKGELINDKGLEPNIQIEMTPEDEEKEKDPQLDKALELVRKL